MTTFVARYGKKDYSYKAKSLEQKYSAACDGCGRFFFKVHLQKIPVRDGSGIQELMICKGCKIRQSNEYREKVAETFGITDDGHKGLLRVYRNSVQAWADGKRGREHSITFDFVLGLYAAQGGKCALSGVDMLIHEIGNGHPLQPSLDRIDNRKGYVPENVQWVCYELNRMKGVMSTEDFVRMCISVAVHWIDDQDNEDEEGG